MLIFLQKSADVIKIKRAFVLKAILSETKYVYARTYQISGFKRNSNEF